MYHQKKKWKKNVKKGIRSKTLKCMVPVFEHYIILLDSGLIGLVFHALKIHPGINATRVFHVKTLIFILVSLTVRST